MPLRKTSWLGRGVPLPLGEAPRGTTRQALRVAVHMGSERVAGISGFHLSNFHLCRAVPGMVGYYLHHWPRVSRDGISDAFLHDSPPSSTGTGAGQRYTGGARRMLPQQPWGWRDRLGYSIPSLYTLLDTYPYRYRCARGRGVGDFSLRPSLPGQKRGARDLHLNRPSQRLRSQQACWCEPRSA